MKHCPLELSAPAKVNLHLNVLSRRPDGYHGILSLFQRISLHDLISVDIWWDDPEISGAQVSVHGLEDLCTPGSDSLTKAIGFWCGYTGIPLRVRLNVKKSIPAGAGLGGGSADAGALLKSLCGLFGRQPDRDFLTACAHGVGADVPFFVTGCGAAVVGGIGEVVRPVSSRALSALVLVPDLASPTAGAYRRLDEAGLGPAGPDALEIEKMYSLAPGRWRFTNDFSRVVFPPRITVPRGCFYTLTGSGSAGVLVGDGEVPVPPEFTGQAFPVRFA